MSSHFRIKIELTITCYKLGTLKVGNQTKEALCTKVWTCYGSYYIFY